MRATCPVPRFVATCRSQSVMVNERNGRSLSGIDLFADIDAAGIAKLEALCQWRDCAAGETIIDLSEDNRDVFFITRGQVRVVNYSFNGREIVFDDLVAGSLFGEFAALDGQPRSANVVAQEASTLAIMTPAIFCRTLAEHPQAAMLLLQRFASIIRVSVDRVMDLSTTGAINRIYGEILRQAACNRTGDDQAEITPAPVHADIAGRAGTSRETVARAFGDLTRKGVIKRQKNSLLITDYARLENLVKGFRGL